jgi:hypothetical protein
MYMLTGSSGTTTITQNEALLVAERVKQEQCIEAAADSAHTGIALRNTERVPTPSHSRSRISVSCDSPSCVASVRKRPTFSFAMKTDTDRVSANAAASGGNMAPNVSNIPAEVIIHRLKQKGAEVSDGALYAACQEICAADIKDRQRRKLDGIRPVIWIVFTSSRYRPTSAHHSLG